MTVMQQVYYEEQYLHAKSEVAEPAPWARYWFGPQPRRRSRHLVEEAPRAKIFCLAAAEARMRLVLLVFYRWVQKVLGRASKMAR